MSEDENGGPPSDADLELEAEADPNPVSHPGSAPRETTTWPELAIGLYERLTGRGATITCEFTEMEVEVPSKAGEDAEHAHWQLDGTLHVSSDDE